MFAVRSYGWNIVLPILADSQCSHGGTHSLASAFWFSLIAVFSIWARMLCSSAFCNLFFRSIQREYISSCSAVSASTVKNDTCYSIIKAAENNCKESKLIPGSVLERSISGVVGPASRSSEVLPLVSAPEHLVRRASAAVHRTTASSMMDRPHRDEKFVGKNAEKGVTIGRAEYRRQFYQVLCKNGNLDAGLKS